MLPPHELKNKTFGKAMRGYNPVEVDEYIEFLIEKYTELYRENDELERKLKATMTRLDELKSDEDSIRSALVDAKRAANKIKSDAENRAEAIIQSAKSSCNSILSDFAEKIAVARDLYAALQHDTVELRQELFARYSQHIQLVNQLTDGIDEENIPEVSELRRSAMDSLKADIAAMYAAPETEEEAPVEEPADEYSETAELEKVSEEIPVELPPEEPADDDIFGEPEPVEELETVREPLTGDKPGLKNSIRELNKIYKESNEDDVINTPDSDLGDDASYLDFVKSVTGKNADKDDNDADFNLLFEDSGKKKKKK